MSKDTDKYTRNYSNFGNYPQPGKNLPSYYDYLKDAGDGSPGMQWMIQNAMGAYGNYHVIEGCEPTINGADVTGTSGYVMWSGSIINVPSESKNTLSDGDYLIIHSDGVYRTTGAKPTGVIIAKRIGSTVYNIAKREDINSIRYIPYKSYYYGDLNTYAGISGNLDNISGYKQISANTGIFSKLGGFSDIAMQDSLDFGNTYHLKGVSQITGSIISGLQITGTSALIPTLKGTNVEYTNITGTSAKITTLGAELSAGSHKITNLAAPGVANDAARKTDVDAVQSDVNGFPDELKNLATAEIQQLENIGSNTISSTQWGYLGVLNQNLRTTDDVIFDEITATAEVNTPIIFSTTTQLAIAPHNGILKYLYMDATATDIYIWQYGATEATELGFIGNNAVQNTPFDFIMGRRLYDDDGSLDSYSHVDDLKLLREVKEWDIKEKIPNKEFPKFKQKVFDMNTLPWIKAHPNVNNMANDDNHKRYSSSHGQKIGYLLSTMKKILERQDQIADMQTDLAKRITKLENQ